MRWALLTLALMGCEAPAPGEADLGVVEPVSRVIEARCGCHGVSTTELAAITDEPANEGLLRWAVDDAGRLADGWTSVTFDRLADFVAPEASPLLTVPLAEGPSSHHPQVFADRSDPDFLALQAWVLERATETPEPPDEALRFFIERAVPVLTRKNCLAGNCHGPVAFNDLKLLPGLPGLRFTPAMQRANRQRMLGANTRLVNLDGDLEQSKQLLKAIPLEEGGILHKGGNHFLEKGDPDYQVLLQWLRLEAARAGVPDLAPQRGIVFVRRPRDTPERVFEDGAFLPGGDLIWSWQGRETNLTAALHPAGPADVRAPEVSYDGRRVLFAMRRAEAEPFDLWELELGGEARQLTFGAPGVHALDPLYAPDPDDPAGEVLLFVSNRAGERCVSSPEGLLGEAEGGSARVLRDAQRSEVAGELVGRRLEVLRGTNAGEVRKVRRHGPGWIEVDRPFPEATDATTHYSIAATPRMAPCYDGYRMRLAPLGAERRTFEETLSRMTWSAGQARRPALRSSGGPILTFLRHGWQSGRPYFNGALFRMHTDGSDFHPHYGERSQIPILVDDRELPNGLEIRIGRSADSYWGGTLILSDHQFGPALEPDNPLDDLDHPFRDGAPSHALPEFFPGWIALEPDSTPRGVSPGGAWRDPFPLPDGSLLVAHAPGPVDLHDPEAAPDFDILRLVPEPAFQTPGRAPGRYRRETVAGGPQAELWPRPVRGRLKERITKKVRLKTDADLMGKPGRVRSFRGFPAGKPGLLQIYDLVGVEHLFEQFTPTGGRHLRAATCPICGQRHDPMDQVTKVRLVGLEPGEDRRFVIAEAELEPDGSFQALVPSRTSFEVQALNPQGMAVSALRRWLYLHPGEKHTLSVPRALYAQTCGGCHGSLSGRREDVLRRPDVITSASRTQAVWDPRRHARRTPTDYSEARRAVTWREDVQPLIETRCAGCHDSAPLDLTGPGAYEALRGRVEHREGLAIRSPLLETLMGQELHAPGKARGAPHPAERPLDESELQLLVRWIDLRSPRGAR